MYGATTDQQTQRLRILHRRYTWSTAQGQRLFARPPGRDAPVLRRAQSGQPRRLLRGQHLSEVRVAHDFLAHDRFLLVSPVIHFIRSGCGPKLPFWPKSDYDGREPFASYRNSRAAHENIVRRLGAVRLARSVVGHFDFRSKHAPTVNAPT